MTRKEVVVQFSPGTGPYDTPAWVTLTAGGPNGNRVLSAEWEWGRHRDDEAFPPGRATIELRNHDRLFDPENTAGTYFGDLRPRVPFRLRTSDGEDLFYGFVEDGWEQTYDHPADGACTVQLIDLLGVLEGDKLPGVFEHAVLALGPLHYWPLTDLGGGGGVTDLGSGNRPGTPEENPSVGPELFPGLGPTVQLDGDVQRIDISRSPLAYDSFHAMVMAVFSTSTTPDVGDVAPIYIHSDGNTPAVDVSCMFVHPNGTLRYEYIQGGTGFTLASDGSVADGRPHIAFVQSDGGGFDYGVAVDDATLFQSVVSGGALAGNGSALGGTPFAPPAYTDDYFEGAIGHVAIFAGEYSDADRQSIIDALACLDGARSDEQIAWALDRLGIPAGMRNLDQGRSIMGPARTAGLDALEFLRRVTDTEQGALFVDHHDGGKIRFVERFAPWLASRSSASQATFSDDPNDSTAVRVEPGTLMVEANGIRTVINRADVSWAGGTESAENVASVAAYGPRGRSIDTLASGPQQARSIAQWVADLRAEPAVRVRGLGLDPAAAEDAFPVAVDLRPFDLVTHRTQPSATGSVTTRNLLIQGGKHRAKGLDWECSFSTEPTPADLIDLFILGTSELDGPDVLAY